MQGRPKYRILWVRFSDVHRKAGDEDGDADQSGRCRKDGDEDGDEDEGEDEDHSGDIGEDDGDIALLMRNLLLRAQSRMAS